MTTKFSDQTKPSIENTVSQIMQTGKLTRQAYFDLVTLFLSDFLVTEEERIQINLVFDNMYKGKIQFID
jgi:hypothetical protein